MCVHPPPLPKDSAKDPSRAHRLTVWKSQSWTKPSVLRRHFNGTYHHSHLYFL